MGKTRTANPPHTVNNSGDAAVDGEHVNISAKMLGRIASLPVNEGDTVRAGQLLVKLDDADLKAQEAQAAASLEYAKKSLDLAKVNLTRSEDDFTRIKKLNTAGAATAEQYIHAMQGADTSRAQLSMAQAQVEITVDVHASAPFKGRIGAGILPPAFSIGEFTKTTQRIPVRIDFVDPPGSLLLVPGMSVEVKVKSK